MITFLDENDVEYGALATIKATNAVNGERSLTGTIVSGDYVLSNIERGWRLRFDDEYYVVTYAKPVDEGRDVQVEFDAVHQFFWDFDKSSVYDQLTDGSHTFVAYLDFIFKNSGYSYTVDTALNVHAFEKQSFGFKKRLTLFNDIITSTGVEFQVNGKVVRILEKVGTDLSTVVRKNFNMNELTIEKNIGDFVTYQKGFGAYFDEEDHSKGRLEVEYTSPLASVYGKLEAEPFVDERYSQSSSLLAVLKENVDNSYTISVSLDMEDLTRAGYKYKQPIAGDYIMAINETLDFQEKIRIVSFTSEYGVDGQLIKHTVTCNDIGSVKKLSAGYNLTKKQASSASATANNAYSVANKALISADGKNTNYYGDSFPADNPKGTLKKGDLLFLTVGDTVKQYYWNGADWIINPVLDDVEAFKEQIAEELKDVPNREEFENKIAEELATSKAEISTQIETAKTQAESNAKEYADTINQETAKVAEQANTAADAIKADLVNVKNNLTETSLVANNAQAAVDAAKQDLANSVDAVNTKVDNAKAELTQTKQQLTTVAGDLSQAKTDLQNAVSAVDTKATNLKSDLAQAKQDLNSQAQQLQAQANAQSELTKRVSSVEKTANGTKTTVSELSKTVAQNGKDITSVTNRTKTVEDDLANTKTTLTQVQTTANSASQKTATLETGLDGLSAKFDNLKIGGRNLLTKTNQGKTLWSWKISSGGTTAENFDVDGVNAVKLTRTSDASLSWDYIQYKGLIRKLIEPDTKYTLSFDVKPNVDVTFSAILQRGDGGGKLTNSVTMNKATANQWTKVSCVLTSKATLPDESGQVVYLAGMPTANGNWLIIKNIKLEKGNIATDYSPNEADLEQKVAEYKQNADQNYVSLQTTVQNLDGTVQHNKTVADQTAQGFRTRIESLETYKNGESERANAYFESAKTETAKQLTAERTAIAKDYVAKSTYTSDVTGIRNDLSATTTTANTTKTNLANYQASNDRAVANLQSNIQTANGDISSLKTKVEAVPGQITSAVSAVEGKIPKSVDTVNLIKNTDKPFTMGYGITNTTWDDDKKWAYLDLTDPNVSTAKAGEILPQGQFSDFKPVKGTTYTQSILIDTDATFNPNGQPQNSWFTSQGHNQKRGYFEKLSDTTYRFWSTCTWQLEDIALRAFDWYGLHTVLDFRNSGTYLAFYKPKLTTGTLPSDWNPSPEDYDDAIAQVKSEIKQTADGITLLATKTELNTAKNELQSGITTATNKANSAQSTANNNAQIISTHTTQISALNTGLSAKVSQSDFNTLSGRVTTAENNITAKANELSSKITSVEGKIPTEIGSANLLRKTAVNTENLKLFGKTDTTVSVVEKDRHQVYKLVVSGSNNAGAYFNGNDDYYNLVKDRNYTFSFWVLTNKDKNFNMSSLGHIQAVNNHSDKVGSDSLHQHTTPVYSTNVIRANTWTKVWCTFKATSNSFFKPYFWYLKAGDEIYIYDMMLNEGKVPLSYTPAPEDAINQISSLSSELKQTKDGITLLATKTELNNAKNELQSGINAATNKANNNAQTISTHTSQISALNTGLQAKVSQTDFNTLSGRVTTAENNITAKANELTSKITSVEGKIPTDIGTVNLVKGTGSAFVMGFGITNTTWDETKKQTILDFSVPGVRRDIKNEILPQGNKFFDFIPIKGTTYTQSIMIDTDATFNPNGQAQCTWFANGQHNPQKAYIKKVGAQSYQVWSTYTWNLENTALRAFDLFNLHNLLLFRTSGTYLAFYKPKLTAGNLPSDWSPAPEDYDNKLASAQSEFKQTTDSIKASVTSLDKSTVKSSSLTINADGIVMKAGKSTTDVANAIGSYFAVNQNAINLFSDKINVKGNMIVNGAITSDKIASKSINTAHLNGKIITADVIATNAITADAIKAGAVTTDKMSANSINGDRIAAGTLDAAKIKAGSITASQIASGTITSNQIKAGGISSANIAAGAITGDKIAAGAIDANKIAANAITANMIRGGKLNSTNGATVFDLNAGTLTFNNNYGYIQRVASDKVFEITTHLSTSSGSQEFLTSAFNIRKSDNSRQAGVKFTLYNTVENKPTAEGKINADALILYDSQNTRLFSMHGKNTFAGGVNFQGWGDIPIAKIHGGLVVNDIGIGSHMKPLLAIVEELCKKAGILWI